MTEITPADAFLVDGQTIFVCPNIEYVFKTQAVPADKWTASPSGEQTVTRTFTPEEGGSDIEILSIHFTPPPNAEDEFEFDIPVMVTVIKVEIIRPVIDPEHLGNNNYVFDEASPGVCRVSCIAKITPDTPEVRAFFKDKLVWTIDGIDGSKLTWKNGGSTAGSGVYDSAFNDWREEAIFTGLPVKNSEFGNKTATLSVCGKTFKGTAQIFYTKDAKNHPGTDSGKTPNWYYYWSQTSANSGTHVYGGNGRGLGKSGGDIAGQMPFSGPNAGTAFIFDQASVGGAGYFPQFKKRKFIDCFATVVRHEGKHKADYFVNWNPYRRNLDNDEPGKPDFLKDGVEPSLKSMVNAAYNPKKQDTDADGVIDGEDYASTAENDWTDGSADAEDWAMPGSQILK